MTNPCPHYWTYESLNGTPTIQGTCRLCGEVKRFKVSISDEKIVPTHGRIYTERSKDRFAGLY